MNQRSAHNTSGATPSYSRPTGRKFNSGIVVVTPQGKLLFSTLGMIWRGFVTSNVMLSHWAKLLSTQILLVVISRMKLEPT